MNHTNIRDIEQVFKVVLNSVNKPIYTWSQYAKEVVRRTGIPFLIRKMVMMLIKMTHY